MKPTLFLYHNPCPDGMACAAIATRFLSDPELVGVSYGAPPPDVKGRRVIIADFSYPREVLLQMAEQAEHIDVIDHHLSAAKALADLKADRLGVKFNMAKCGATLLWEHFTGARVPEVLRYVQDRDLWTWALPNSREISAALQYHVPKTPQAIDALLDIDDLSELVKVGATALAPEREIVQRAARNAIPICLAGVEGLAVNSCVLPSEIGEYLRDTTDTKFTCIWAHEGSIVRVSLRAGAEAVLPIAQAYGGGGHPNSAGFEVSLSEWLKILNS